jgi:hypothetical protein
MVLEIGDSIRSRIATIDDQHSLDTRVVYEFRAHHAGLTGNDHPRSSSRDPPCGRVANDIHFGVMTTDLGAGSRHDFLRIA